MLPSRRLIVVPGLVRSFRLLAVNHVMRAKSLLSNSENWMP
jgi:hypothetical protein